jgi:homoserine O-acetyltransferase
VTVGEPSGEPVLILHGTTQSGTGMLSPPFAGELFGPGQPLDANKLVVAQYRLVTEALGLRHIRLVLGNSMGGMHTRIWG